MSMHMKLTKKLQKYWTERAMSLRKDAQIAFAKAGAYKGKDDDISMYLHNEYTSIGVGFMRQARETEAWAMGPHELGRGYRYDK